MKVPKPWLQAEIPFTSSENYHRRNWKANEIDHDFDVRFIDERAFVKKCLDLTYIARFELKDSEQSQVQNVCIARRRDGTPKKMADTTKGQWIQNQITSGIYIQIIKNLENAAKVNINADNVFACFRPRTTDRWPCSPDQKHFYSWYTSAHVALRRNNIWPYRKDTELQYVKNEWHRIDRKRVIIHGSPGAGIDPIEPIFQLVYDQTGKESTVPLALSAEFDSTLCLRASSVLRLGGKLSRKEFIETEVPIAKQHCDRELKLLRYRCGMAMHEFQYGEENGSGGPNHPHVAYLKFQAICDNEFINTGRITVGLVFDAAHHAASSLKVFTYSSRVRDYAYLLPDFSDPENMDCDDPVNPWTLADASPNTSSDWRMILGRKIKD